MMKETTILFLVIIIGAVNTEIITKSRVGKESLQNVVYQAKEDSILQCANRCMRISKDTVMMFKDESNTCSCVKLMEGKDQGSTGPIVYKKHTERKLLREPLESIVKNVALNKPSFQSSTAPIVAIPNEAKLANDGKRQTRSHTDYKKAGIWTVDLEETFEIRSIKIILNQNHLTNKSYGRLRVLTRVDKRDPWVNCYMFKVPKVIELKTTCQDHQGQTRARYVRIVNPIVAPLALREVEVYA